MIENNAIGEGITLKIFKNSSAQILETPALINRGLVQFYLGLGANSSVQFNMGKYVQPITANGCLFLYNPENELPVNLEIPVNATVIAITITVNKLHHLFVQGAEEITFINKDNIHKKYYLSQQLNPALELIVNQMVSNQISGLPEQLYRKAKVYEFLALFFKQDENADVEQCPFLKDETNVKRIKQAKSIIIERLNQPPTIAQLAKEIGLNEYKLKEGFKNIYGKTVFQFLHDYRMDTARNLLGHKKLLVNETALEVGYSNPSHFIAAFKKKFGITPKKYITNHT